MKKMKSLLAFLAASAVMLSACGGGGSAPSSSTAAPSEPGAPSSTAEPSAETPAAAEKTGGTLRLGQQVLDTQMANKSPFATAGTFEDLFRFIYEPALLFNETTGEVLPSLANGYEWNADFTELSLPVNTAIKWHDGESLTPDDLIYTIQVLKDVPMFDKYGLWGKIDSVSAEGDVVKIRVKEPFTSLPYYLTKIWVVPRHIWEKEDAANFLNDTPIGTGPFVYRTYNTGTDIQFDANKDYWRGAPKVDSMIIYMYNTAPNCTLALLKGEIDAAISTIAMPSAPEFRSKENAQIQVYPGLGNFSVQMNHENELLADVNVRKAMCMAINQEELITKGESNCVLPTVISWLPDIFGDSVNKNAAAKLTYDVAAAQKVLEDAGYAKGDDGIYQKDGKRLSFTYHNASGAPAQQMEAGMIQQWLLNLGVEIIPKLATWPELTKLAQNGEYDLIQLGINFPPDPYAALNTVFHSSMTAPVGTATPGMNYTRFRNDELDKLLDEASKETDEAKVAEALNKAQDIIADNYVFLPMYNSSGHIPYYDGTALTGWTDADAPVMSVLNLINIRPAG